MLEETFVDEIFHVALTRCSIKSRSFHQLRKHVRDYFKDYAWAAYMTHITNARHVDGEWRVFICRRPISD